MCLRIVNELDEMLMICYFCSEVMSKENINLNCRMNNNRELYLDLDCKYYYLLVGYGYT